MFCKVVSCLDLVHVQYCNTVIVWYSDCLQTNTQIYVVFHHSAKHLHHILYVHCIHIHTHTYFLFCTGRSIFHPLDNSEFSCCCCCCLLLVEIFLFYYCSLTDRDALRLLQKCRPLLGHINMRGCLLLTAESFKYIGQCQNLQDLNLSECQGLTVPQSSSFCTHIIIYFLFNMPRKCTIWFIFLSSFRFSPLCLMCRMMLWRV